MTLTLTHIAVVCLVALAAHSGAQAQTITPARTPPETIERRTPTQTPAVPAQDAERAADAGSRTSADETFELNIVERRITEKNFAASTAVEIGDEAEHGLSLRVGVAVGAEEIDVLLRNVRGSVRFRASLEEVLKRLGVNRVAPPPPP